MATILFGKNETGAVFEVRVKAAKVQPLLAAGYVCDPADFKEVEEVVDISDELSEEVLRSEAKGKGIRNYHNKKIETLKRDLGYVD